MEILRTYVYLVFQAAEVCGSLEIDNALAAVRELEKELEEIRESAENGTLKSFLDENVSF